MPDLYVIVALFDFGEFPIFNELVGTTGNITQAFYMLDDYDCKKIIGSKYEMDIEENLKVRGKSIGIRKDTDNKVYYEELRHYTYQIKGEEEKYPVKVTLSIFQA